MKYLHDEKILFSDILEECSYETGISKAIIEKDYYVTLLLKEIVKKCPDIIFKGGMSLSKCYRIINRFSEDIDLGLDVGKATQGMKKKLKNNIKEAINALGFSLDNEEEIYSRRNFNRYQIKYPILEHSMSLKPYLYVETALFNRAFPCETKEADSFIYRFLKSRNMNDIIEKYQLEPYLVKVQTINRTYIDKLFALGDYYLKGVSTGYSRHLYDLYKLSHRIVYDDSFYQLFDDGRAERMKDEKCLSAREECSLKKILNDIYNNDYYKDDYTSVTEELLFEKVLYTQIKNNFLDIINHLKD